MGVSFAGCAGAEQLRRMGSQARRRSAGQPAASQFRLSAPAPRRSLATGLSRPTHSFIKRCSPAPSGAASAERSAAGRARGRARGHARERSCRDITYRASKRLLSRCAAGSVLERSANPERLQERSSERRLPSIFLLDGASFAHSTSQRCSASESLQTRRT